MIHEQAMLRSTRTNRARLAALLALASVALGVGCHLVIGVEERSQGDVDASTRDADARDDAEVGPGPADGGSDGREGCDLAKPFGTPAPLSALNSVDGEFGATLSVDELEIFYTTTATGRAVVHRAVRRKRTDPFDPGAVVAELATIPPPHWSVALGRDDNEIFVTGRSPPRDIYRATRPRRDAPFSGAVRVAFEGWDAGAAEEQVFASAAGQLYLGVQQGPQFDLYVAPPDDAGGNLAPVPLVFFNTTGASEAWPVQSFDGLTFYYSSGDGISEEILQSRRSNVATPFPAGTALTFPASPRKHPLWLSPDGCRLYLSQDNVPGGGGGADLFVAERPP
ncbi:MAG: hypothetical protein JNL38_35355 [Myxococcales bacterium]|nr:hypothetical protein [Myxococcales bacterium]